MIRLCISTQTPPFRPEEILHLPAGKKVSLAEHPQSVGGVVPMMFSLLQSSVGRWVHPSPLWISFGGSRKLPDLTTEEGVRLSFVDLPEAATNGYLKFKRSMWNAFHGMGSFPFDPKSYTAFLEYSNRTARKLLEHVDETDAYYINDYQQIQIGAMIGPAAPALLRWHIPFNLEAMPVPLRQYMLKCVEGFDGVVLSTRWEMESLIRAGYRGRAYQIYPYLNEKTLPKVSASATAAFRERWRLGTGPVILVVGRMDPQKRQDIALRAFVPVRRRYPHAVLVLVGNGSFTSSQEEGLRTTSTSGSWRAELGRLARSLRISESVRFTGYLSDAEIHAAYESCDALLLTSTQEGFGLVGIEAWMHHKPIIVSSGAGISELVIDGVNGFVAESGSVEATTSSLLHLLKDRSGADRMGEFGHNSARQCYVAFATKRLRRIFNEVIEEYVPTGPRTSRPRRR